MLEEWLTTTAVAVVMVAWSGLGVYACLLLLARLMGPRSFAKFSTFDFAITVAIGTVLASGLLNKDPPLLRAVFALVVLFSLQVIVSKLRRHSSLASRLIDNPAILLMDGSEVLHDHLARAHMTEDDLWSKLRQAGITHPCQVFAVIMETTGDVAVLEKRDDQPVARELFEKVLGGERLLRGEATRAP